MYSRIVLRKINLHGIWLLRNFETLFIPVYMYIYLSELPEIFLHLVAEGFRQRVVFF